MFPIIFLYLFNLCQCQGGQPEVVYVVNFDSPLEVCDEDSAGFMDTTGVHVERFNETIAYMYGDIKFHQDVGPDTLVEIILKKEASGKYEVILTHEIRNLCTEVQIGPESDYYNYMKYFGIPDTCPFEAGVYPIKDFVLNTDELPLNSNAVGPYQAFMTLYKSGEKESDREFLCCITMKIIVEVD